MPIGFQFPDGSDFTVHDDFHRYFARTFDPTSFDVPVRLLIERAAADRLLWFGCQQRSSLHFDVQLFSASGRQETGAAVRSSFTDSEAVDLKVVQMTQPVTTIASAVSDRGYPVVKSQCL